MSLPPVEEVAGKAGDEKKSERLKSFGGGGSKREWWVQNMKGKGSKQRFLSREGAVRLVEVNGNGSKGEGDSKKHETGNQQRFVSSSEGVVRMLVLGGEDTERDVDQGNFGESGNVHNGKEGQMDGDLKKGKDVGMILAGNIDTNMILGGNKETSIMDEQNTHKDTHSKTTKKPDDHPFELKIEELDTIERLHVKMDPRDGGQRRTHLLNPESQIEKVEKIQSKSMAGMEGYIMHERGEGVVSQAEFAPPDQRLMSYLLCIFFSLVMLALLLSSLFVLPWASWFPLEEETACPCSCPSD